MPNTHKAPAQSGSPLSPDALNEITLNGISVVQGLRRGRVHRFDPLPEISKDRLRLIEKTPNPSDFKQICHDELEKFNKGLSRAISILNEKFEQLEDPSQKAICESQILMLRTSSLRRSVERYITTGISAEEVASLVDREFNSEAPYHFNAASAVKIYYLSKINESLRKLADPDISEKVAKLIRSKIPDYTGIAGLLVATIRNRGTNSLDFPKDESVILVTDHLDPPQALSLTPEVAALITETGGDADHTFMICNALGIPYVTGVDINNIPHGSDVLLIADTGKVILNPDRVTYVREHATHAELQRSRIKLPLEPNKLPVTRDNWQMSLAATIDLDGQLEGLAAQNINQIGLVRTEMRAIKFDRALSTEEMIEQYTPIIQQVDSVTLRFFDFGGDKIIPFKTRSQSRGIALLLEDGIRDAFFIPQVDAFLRSSVDREINILIPMIKDCSHIIAVREIMAEREAFLARIGVPTGGYKIGPMIENVGAVELLPSIFPYSDFYSVGSTDLQESITGIPRTANTDRSHPGMILVWNRIIDQHIQYERSSGRVLPCSFCGKPASDIIHVPILTAFSKKLGKPITISINPLHIEQYHYAISISDSESCARMLPTVVDPQMRANTVSELVDRLKQYSSSAST